MGAFAPATEQRAILNPMINKSTGATGPMTQEVLKQLTNSTIRLVTHGRVDYEDVFGDQHWFTFCMNLGFPQNPNFGIWPEHNDSDD